MTSNSQHVRDIATQARARFPDAFKNVGDPALYTFRSETLDDGEDVDLLQIGLYDIHKNTKDRKPLWTRIVGRKIEYYFESNSQLHKLKHGAITLYPDSGPTRHRDAKVPFSVIAPRVWPSDSMERTAARELTRRTLESLIIFAFVLTERREEPGHWNIDAFLGELQQLCEELQQNQHTKSKTATKSAIDEGGEDVKEESGSARYPEKQLLRVERLSSTLSYHTRTKRLAEEMDGTSADYGVRKVHNRMVDDSHSPPPRSYDGRTSPTPQPAPSSVEPQTIYENLVESITAQKKEEWAKEKAALQGRIKSLQAQVAEKSREGDEWKRNYQLLTESLEGVTRNAMQRL